LSRAEEITSEVRKLVFTCRSLEAQLQQSVPKKFHQELVAKMQGNIDSLSADLSATKSELGKATQRVVTLESQVASQTETISSQGKSIDSLNLKLSEAQVFATEYTKAVSKVQELESRISSMVEYSQYTSLQRRCGELEAQVANMVPKEQFSALQVELANSVPTQKYDDLKRALEQMVPREQFNIAQSRISDLERALSDSVPKADFEDLAGKITQITKEAIELASRASAAIGLESSAATSEPVESKQPTIQANEIPVPTSDAKSDVHEEQPEITHPVPEPQVAFEKSPSQPFVAQAQTSPQEIAEVQSQLSEINSAIETGANSIYQAPVAKIVESERGFRFSNTEFCARSGMEFLEDVERVDISVLAAHCQRGDFERWFKDVLSDETCAESLQKVRESNVSGEELRTMVVAAIAPRYKA
jgi:chromosome segregation ATPase